MLKKIKHLFAVMLLAGFVAQPALAESFNQDDMTFAFGHSSVSNDLGDMALLSSQEMMETEGEVLPLLLVARIGYTAYRGYKVARSARSAKHAYRSARAGWSRSSSWTSSYGRYKSGGFGYNIKGTLRHETKPRRLFGIGYNSFKVNGKTITRPSVHYGRNSSQAGKHRPYQGGW